MTKDMDRIERIAVRVVVIDAADAILLVSTTDASNPNFPTSWELPGGAMLPGETVPETAARELREEVGLRLQPADFSIPLWKRTVLYTYRGERRRQTEEICVARLAERTPAVDLSGREPFEVEDHGEARWWPIHKVRTGLH